MKRPAFQFYPGDWRRDTALQSCSLEARGLWIELLCLMHDGEPYGHVRNGLSIPSAMRIATMVGLGHRLKFYRELIRELQKHGVLCRDRDGAIYSGRMVRDEEIRRR